MTQQTRGGFFRRRKWLGVAIVLSLVAACVSYAMGYTIFTREYWFFVFPLAGFFGWTAAKLDP